MIELVDAVTTALGSGTNIVTALRDATGYSVEQMSVASGLSSAEIVDLEAGTDNDTSKLTRLASALGLPAGTIPES
ncbi:helix-turn-helix domain-containing protein [Mesorhizobium microcysteis]|jgi:transcriptional regulator with XRE-family HTH domain|uniref:Helix-turn-helix domain-containing protein n=1 Tax=Neoaquamicrobium microcysteis TaxID=2682781 RepID=A0A5D4GPV6_9HYPH|nr:helix-turn-helix transcriptional regulator [Mesorhizobium microcysteis]TYR30901.1 helix-turn-helix domain-containing protein [Mesorhizobium microcysteis]